MNICFEVKDDSLNIVLPGQLNAENVGEAEKRLQEIWDAETFSHVVIDCKELEDISAESLRVLMKLYRKVGRISIVHTPEKVYRVFSEVGYTDIMDIKKMEDHPIIDKDDKLNDTEWPVSFVPVAEMFEKQVQEHPDRLAVVTSKLSLTYKELNDEVNRAANVLRYHSVGVEDKVLILLPRTIMSYVANLAVLKAGAAFVTVSTEYPDDRIAYIYEDAGCSQIITTHRIAFERLELMIKIGNRPMFLEHLVASPWTETPRVHVTSNNLAYCIYTSGSTGKPKGVMVEQGNLNNFLDHNPKNHETMGIAEKSKVLLANAALTFDVSVMEEFIPLTSGNTIVLADTDEIINPLRIRDLMLKYKVDGLCATPSYVNTLLAIPQLKEAMAQIKVYDFGAEAFPGPLYDAIHSIREDAYIMNGYGPTETTISCTMKVIDSAENITIGKPNANVYCFIVDENNQEVKKGEIGELLICGKGVSRGYKNLPEKTAESFIHFRGMRAYKSGDLARINEQNEIEFHGRRDNQVKYHGLRIELGEIEKNMGDNPKIRQCVAMVYEDRFLCLYYVPKEEVTSEELREYAQGHLAHYMIPDIFVPIDEMPMTPNMKVDKKKLPVPELPKTEYAEPSSPMQEKILQIVQECSPEYHLGVENNLLDLGFTSLDFMKILANLSDEFAVGITLGEIHEHPTVVELEQLILSKPHIDKTDTLKDKYPVTASQAVLYESMIANNTVENLVPFIMVMDKPMDIERLKAAVRKTFDNHPALFARFEKEKDGTIVMRPCTQESEPYEIPVIETTQVQMLQIESELAVELIGADDYPLFRVRIYQTEEKIYLYIAIAHIISDGASVDILAEDIADAYNKNDLKKEETTIFAYNEEQDFFKSSPMYAQTIGYYTKLLEGLDHWTTVPQDQTNLPQGTDSVSVPFTIKAEEIQAYMDNLSISGNVLFASLLGLTLAAESGDNDIPFVFVFNGRNDSRLRRTVGCTVGDGLVRLKVQPGDSLKDYYRAVQKQMFDALTYEEMPMFELMGIHPELMNYLYIFQSESPDQTIEGKTVKTLWLESDDVEIQEDQNASTEQDIYQMLTQVYWHDTVLLKINYQSGKYSRERMEKMAAYMDRLLQIAVSKNNDTLTLKELMTACK